MKNIIRLISLCLCVALLFSACSSGKKPDTELPEDQTVNEQISSESTSNKGDGKISLPYNKTDGLNPYFAQSYENQYICSVLFDPLYSISEKYEAEGNIAESVSVTDNIATVRLRGGIDCRGSSEINAEDVVYSFNMAKNSYYWGNCLSGIISASATGMHTVDFTLEFNDIYVAEKLCFPVVKVGTGDSKDAVPTGSGDYYRSGDRLINVLNDDKVIYLSPIGTNESAENAVNIGVTDIYFNDMADCDYTVAAGKTDSVLLNNMVYLGLNSERGALNSYIRNAIAAKLDSEQIALSYYQGHASGAKLPVNPQSVLAQEIQQIETKGNTELAENIIDRCGYTRYSGKARTNGAYTLSLSLIVNSDNRFRVAAAYSVADSLAECGFLITVRSLSFDDYSKCIASGDFDMYIGEVKLDASMDISEFFKESNVLSAGINRDERVAKEYFNYRAGKMTSAEYYDIFAEYYPFVPLVFRKGYVVTSDDVNLSLKRIPYSLYDGI